MKEVFNNAIDSLKSKPAEFTIIALMLFGGLIVIPMLEDQEKKFWIFIIIILSITLLLILIVLQRKKSYTDSNNNSKTAQPQKLQKLISSLYDIDYFHKSIIYKITFKQIEGDFLWILFESIKTSKNCSKKSKETVLIFPFFARDIRDPKAEIDNQEYTFDGRENAKNNMGYQIDTIIPPNEEITVKFSALVKYNLTESEIYQSYRYCENMYFYFYDEISEKNGEDLFTVVFEPLHSYKGTNGQVISNGNSYKKKIELTDGLLPYQGIYLKWRLKK